MTAPAPSLDPSSWSPDRITLAWLGHATVLLQLGDTRLITDPVLESRIGIGRGWLKLGPRRYSSPALTPRQLPPLDGILLTHAHMDHVEGIPAVKRELDVPILLHPADAPLYAAAPMQAQMFGLRMEPLPPVDGELVVGDAVRFGECALEVRFAPGHAPGHVILVGDGVALVGDVIFAGSIGRTDLPGGDFATLMRSIREQVLTLPDETTLHTGHGPDTTVGRERVSNPFVTGVYGGGGFA
jgi:glyoxylase-like metal-dependent hydrolase (beta-lactamase superfamily II)